MMLLCPKLSQVFTAPLKWDSKYCFFSTLYLESPDYAYHLHKILTTKDLVLYIFTFQNTLYLPYKLFFSYCY